MPQKIEGGHGSILAAKNWVLLFYKIESTCKNWNYQRNITCQDPKECLTSQQSL